MIERLYQGSWLGIDVGSSRGKVCSFCLVESDGAGGVEVRFERGPAGADYPEKNVPGMLDVDRRPTYLNESVQCDVEKVLATSVLVDRWLSCGSDLRAVAIDAPVALASGNNKNRLTETHCTQAFDTPNEAGFEKYFTPPQKDGDLKSKVYWKCVGFTIYHWLAGQSACSSTDRLSVAARTCQRSCADVRIYETFPSDIYKRANGRLGTLNKAARDILQRLTAASWSGGSARVPPTAAQTTNLDEKRRYLHFDLEAARDKLCEMRKSRRTHGDLWDAFICAYVACCEDHDAADLHGERSDDDRLRREGAILTVKKASKRKRPAV